jgi:hypothetical protein
MTRDPVEIRAAAVAYVAAADDIDGDPGISDFDPRWETYHAANDRFTEAIGFGFCAETEDVAQLLIEVLPDG